MSAIPQRLIQSETTYLRADTRDGYHGKNIIAASVAAVLLYTLASPAMGAAAAAYPERPVRVLVGFSPGGGSDIIARLMSRKLTEAWGQQFVVDNRAGSGGIIASEIVSKATPDGYTLMMATSSLAIQPSVRRKMPFDTLRDFTPITLACSAPYLLLLTPSVEANSVSELIKLAKAHPGKLNYASAGAGSTLHLSAELFNSLAGVSIVHVPYKGAVAIGDLMAGQVQMAFFGLSTALPLVRAGKLKALGVTSEKRSATAPDIPTIAESGLPGYNVTAWYGLMGPAGVSPAIVSRLHGESVKVLNASDSRKSLAAMGIDPIASTPEQFSQTISSEIKQWGEVVKRAGLKPE